MKLKKLLIAAFAAMISLSVNAQLTDGTVYWIQDVGTGQFISQGANWGTQATVQEVGGLGFQVVYVSDGVYKLKNIMWNTVNNADLGLRTSDRFCDQAAGDVTLVASGDGYKLNTSDGGYLCNNGDTNGDGVKRLGSTSDAAAATVWKFLTKAQYDAAIQTYKDGKATTYATNLGLSATSVSALESILDENYRPKDYTSSINNPTLGSNWNGWAHAAASGSNRAEGAGIGSGCAEFWNGCGAANQTVSGLPNGLYKVEFVGTFRPKGNTDSEKLSSDQTSSPAFVYANDAQVEFLHWIDVPAKANGRSGITVANGYNNSLYTYVTDGTLKIGIVQGCWEGGNMWCPFGQFRLTYYTDQVTDEEIAALVASIPASGTVPTAVTTNLTSLKTTLESTKTIPAFKELSNAITAANEMATNYARYNSVKTAVLAIATSLDTSATDTELNNATTNDAINTAIANLRAAFLTELPNVSIPVDPGYIDVTAVMVDNASVRQNTDFWTSYKYPSSPNGGSFAKCSNNECEFYQQTFKFYQTLALTPGTWEFGVTGFHRAGNHSTYFYAGTDRILIPGVENSVVNTMAQAETYFDGGNGKVALKFLIEAAGNVEIGIDNQDEATDRWTIFRDFTLKYYGAPDYSVYEDQWTALVAEATTAKTTHANVTGTELTALNAAIADSPAGSNLKATYNAKITALQNALTTFNAAAPNYDVLVAEIAKAKALGIATATADSYAATSSTTAATALANTQALKVAEYTFVTTNYPYAVNLGTWNASDNAGTMTSQHWDGTSTSEYLEQGGGDKAYSLNSWTVTYDQTLNLPAGNYVFKVAGRTASDHVVLTLNVNNVSDPANPVLLGTVNDFPKGDVGLGINKAGATSYDPEDAAGFANNGNGRGWEWRYVQFTLAADAAVKVGVVATADAQYRWMGFCNATVQTDDEATNSLIAYNVALSEASLAINNNNYTNVTGSERTALQGVIDNDASVDKTDKDAIDAAKAALVSATTTFTGAKAAYDTFVAAKNVSYEDNQPYASAAKYAAIATAQAATATSADDATAKTNAIIAAYRKYVESNALAEGVTGAESITIQDPNMEVTYDGENHTFGAWEVFGQTNGTINLYDNQSFTDGDGNANYKYADIYKGDNNAGIRQSVSLAPGRYLLTVTARANTTADAAFRVFAGEKTADIQRIGNSGGVFDKGWNDASVEFDVLTQSDLYIGVQSGNGKNLWWSATRFRLVRISDVANMKVGAKTYGSFVAPFAVAIPDHVAAYKVTGVDTNGATLTLSAVDTTIPKNTPVVLYNDNETAVDQVFAGGFKIADAATEGLLTGTFREIQAPDGSYILQKQNEVVGFYQVDLSEAQPNVPANRAYLEVPAGPNPVKAFYLGGGEDAIKSVMDGVAAGEVYDLSGRKISKLQRGVNIVNGKKVMVK